MGKSMVAWNWMTEHAAKDRTDWAGRLWYSFYERGATMRDFCVTALAYMTQSPPGRLRRRAAGSARRLGPRSTTRQSPGFSALDGLERVLVAYHRPDAAQIPDEEAGAAPDPEAEATDRIVPTTASC